MKAVLVSFFDTNNIGDLLISDQLYKNTLKKFDEVEKFNYLNGRLMTDEHKVQIETFNKEQSGKKKGYRTEISKMLEKTKLLPLNYFYLDKVKKFDLNQFENSIKSADVLIIGGGNMIFDMYKRTLGASRFDQYVEIAKKHKKKIFATSLGIGPFQTKLQEKKAVNALKKCDFVTFRDEKSYSIFNKYGSRENVHVAIDPVFSLPKMFNVNTDSNVIGVNIINNPVYTNDEIVYEKIVMGYAELIQKLALNQHNSIKLFSTETRDYEVINDVYKRLTHTDNIEIVTITDIEELMELYSKLGLLIGARMHSMIVAYTQLIPIIGLAWQPKVKAFFDIIDQSDSCFDLVNINEDIQEILSLSTDKMANDESLQLQKKLDEIKAKNVINEKIIDQIIG